MSFTSVLKKIGVVLLDGSKIATEVMGFPFISQLLGGIKIGTSNVGAVATTITGDFNTLASIVSMTETMFSGAQTGPQKLAAATPVVQQAILLWANSNLPGHNKVKDPALLAKAAGEIAGGFADAMNSFGA